MNDDLDRALRDQARTFAHDGTHGPGDLDEVVQRGRARRKVRLATGSTILATLLVLTTFGLRDTTGDRDIVTGPADSPATELTTPTTSTEPPRSTPSIVPPIETTASSTMSTVPEPAPPSTTPTTALPAPSTLPLTDPTCTWQAGSLRLTYPQGWFTPSETGLNCTLFDPEPFTAEPGGRPPVAVSVALADGDFASYVQAIRSETFATILSEEETFLGGHTAYCYEIQGNGLGYLSAGRVLDGCVIDHPSGPTVFDASERLPEAPSGAAWVRWFAERAVPISR